jgi:Mn-dependent DtxR family transcriptional regulator
MILSMKILAYLAAPGHGTVTPVDLGRQMGITWQSAASRAQILERDGLIRIKRYGKMTSYEITDKGRAEAAETAEGLAEIDKMAKE